MRVLLHDNENGFVAHDLDYTLVSLGETPETALASLAEARKVYLAMCREWRIDPHRPMPAGLVLELAGLEKEDEDKPERLRALLREALHVVDQILDAGGDSFKWEPVVRNIDVALGWIDVAEGRVIGLPQRG